MKVLNSVVKKALKKKNSKNNKSKSSNIWVVNAAKSFVDLAPRAFVAFMPETGDKIIGLKSSLKQGGDLNSALKSIGETLSFIKKRAFDDLVKEAFKNAVSDIRTGKLYNKERQTEYEKKLAGDDGSWDSDADDFGGFAEGDEDIAELESMMKGSKGDDSDVDSSDDLSSVEDKKFIASQKTSLMGSMLVAHNTVVALEAVQKTQAEILRFHVEQTQNFYNASLDFYDTINKSVSAIGESIDKIREASEKQVAMYAGQGSYENKRQKKEKTPFHLKFKELAEEWFGENAEFGLYGLLKNVAANPIGALMENIATSIVPEKYRNFLENLDKTLFNFKSIGANYFANFKNGNFLQKGIFKLFFENENLQEHSLIDTNEESRKIKATPIPFDEQTKFSVVNTIPELLARMLKVSETMSEQMDSLIDVNTDILDVNTDILDIKKINVSGEKKEIFSSKIQERRQSITKFKERKKGVDLSDTLVADFFTGGALRLKSDVIKDTVKEFQKDIHYNVQYLKFFTLLEEELIDLGKSKKEIEKILYHIAASIAMKADPIPYIDIEPDKKEIEHFINRLGLKEFDREIVKAVVQVAASLSPGDWGELNQYHEKLNEEIGEKKEKLKREGYTNYHTMYSKNISTIKETEEKMDLKKSELNDNIRKFLKSIEDRDDLVNEIMKTSQFKNWYDDNKDKLGFKNIIDENDLDAKKKAFTMFINFGDNSTKLFSEIVKKIGDNSTKLFSEIVNKNSLSQKLIDLGFKNEYEKILGNFKGLKKVQDQLEFMIQNIGISPDSILSEEEIEKKRENIEYFHNKMGEFAEKVFDKDYQLKLFKKYKKDNDNDSFLDNKFFSLFQPARISDTQDYLTTNKAELRTVQFNYLDKIIENLYSSPNLTDNQRAIVSRIKEGIELIKKSEAYQKYQKILATKHTDKGEIKGNVEDFNDLIESINLEFPDFFSDIPKYFKNLLTTSSHDEGGPIKSSAKDLINEKNSEKSVVVGDSIVVPNKEEGNKGVVVSAKIGEYIVNEDAVKIFGQDFFDQINKNPEKVKKKILENFDNSDFYKNNKEKIENDFKEGKIDDSVLEELKNVIKTTLEKEKALFDINAKAKQNIEEINKEKNKQGIDVREIAQKTEQSMINAEKNLRKEAKNIKNIISGFTRNDEVEKMKAALFEKIPYSKENVYGDLKRIAPELFQNFKKEDVEKLYSFIKEYLDKGISITSERSSLDKYGEKILNILTNKDIVEYLEKLRKSTVGKRIFKFSLASSKFNLKEKITDFIGKDRIEKIKSNFLRILGKDKNDTYTEFAKKKMKNVINLFKTGLGKNEKESWKEWFKRTMGFDKEKWGILKAEIGKTNVGNIFKNVFLKSIDLAAWGLDKTRKILKFGVRLTGDLTRVSLKFMGKLTNIGMTATRIVGKTLGKVFSPITKIFGYFFKKKKGPEELEGKKKKSIFGRLKDKFNNYIDEGEGQGEEKRSAIKSALLDMFKKQNEVEADPQLKIQTEISDKTTETNNLLTQSVDILNEIKENIKESKNKVTGKIVNDKNTNLNENVNSKTNNINNNESNNIDNIAELEKKDRLKEKKFQLSFNQILERRNSNLKSFIEKYLDDASLDTIDYQIEQVKKIIEEYNIKLLNTKDEKIRNRYNNRIEVFEKLKEKLQKKKKKLLTEQQRESIKDIKNNEKEITEEQNSGFFNSLKSKASNLLDKYKKKREEKKAAKIAGKFEKNVVSGSGEGIAGGLAKNAGGSLAKGVGGSLAKGVGGSLLKGVGGSLAKGVGGGILGTIAGSLLGSVLGGGDSGGGAGGLVGNIIGSVGSNLLGGGSPIGSIAGGLLGSAASSLLGGVIGEGTANTIGSLVGNIGGTLLSSGGGLGSLASTAAPLLMNPVTLGVLGAGAAAYGAYKLWKGVDQEKEFAAIYWRMKNGDQTAVNVVNSWDKEKQADYQKFVQEKAPDILNVTINGDDIDVEWAEGSSGGWTGYWNNMLSFIGLDPNEDEDEFKEIYERMARNGGKLTKEDEATISKWSQKKKQNFEKYMKNAGKNEEQAFEEDNIDPQKTPALYKAEQRDFLKVSKMLIKDANSSEALAILSGYTDKKLQRFYKFYADYKAKKNKNNGELEKMEQEINKDDRNIFEKFNDTVDNSGLFGFLGGGKIISAAVKAVGLDRRHNERSNLEDEREAQQQAQGTRATGGFASGLTKFLTYTNPLTAAASMIGGDSGIGGFVSGASKMLGNIKGNVDSVIAKLAPNEFILRTGAVKRLIENYGTEFLHNMNKTGDIPQTPQISLLSQVVTLLASIDGSMKVLVQNTAFSNSGNHNGQGKSNNNAGNNLQQKTQQTNQSQFNTGKKPVTTIYNEASLQRSLDNVKKIVKEY